MRTLNRVLALFVCFAFLVVPLAWSQVPLSPESKIWIDGTSNKSDWTVEATALSGEFTFGESASDVQAATITVPAAEIVSNRSTIMDRLMHKALMVNEHPEITYVLTASEPVPGTNGGTFTLNTTGELTIAGVTNEIEMVVEGVPQDDGTVRFTGAYTLLMTDYSVKPPTAMFGALHTGNEVTVNVDAIVAAP